MAYEGEASSTREAILLEARRCFADHGYDLNKKVRRLGLIHALSAKAKEGKLVVLDFWTYG